MLQSGAPFEVYHYLTGTGTDVFKQWFNSLSDKQAQMRISARIGRLVVGNFGDCKPLRDGIWELRINWGPGYRVYYARSGKTILLLLCGGDKSRQSADVARSIAYWKDYLTRTGGS